MMARPRCKDANSRLTCLGARVFRSQAQVQSGLVATRLLVSTLAA